MLPCLILVVLWSLTEKGLTSWLSSIMSLVTFPNVSRSTSEYSGRGWPRKTGLSPPVKYFTDRSKAVLFCGSFMFFLSCVCYGFVRIC